MIEIREVQDSDLETFFEHQRDPAAVAMAVFGAREHDPFMENWVRIRTNEDSIARAITVDGQLAGNLLSWSRDGMRYVGYWLGREFWGRGIGTEALRQFVALIDERPLWALVVVTNPGSQRVLEKSGFVRVERRPSPADGVEEFVYVLR